MNVWCVHVQMRCVDDVWWVLRVTMRGNVFSRKVMRASRCVCSGGTCDWPWQAEWCRRPRAGRWIGCSAGARACAVCLDWYALRGSYSGRLNVLIIVAVVYEKSGDGVSMISRDNGGGAEYSRLKTRTFGS